jgi:hypothetical protein
LLPTETFRVPIVHARPTLWPLSPPGKVPQL